MSMDIKSKLKFVIRQKSSSSSSSSSPSSPSSGKSIYRQPSSRPRSSSCSFTHSRYREQQHGSSSSGVQQQQRSTVQQQHRAGTKLQYSHSADDQDYRPRAASVGSPSILKRDHLLRKLATLKMRSKHASFCESVDVVYYDGNENCLSDASSESSVCKLNDIPREDFT